MEAGANQRVAIDDSLVLDFAGLFGEPKEEKQPATSPVEPLLDSWQYKIIPKQENAVERKIEGLDGQQAKGLYLQAQREEEYHRRSLEVYKAYQENIRTSGQLQTEILKGIRAGESVYNLFLKAAKAISLMTFNSLFYSQIEADTRAIYGEGLQEQAPLQSELVEVQKRLIKLRKAQAGELEHDSRERIGRAIAAHEAKIAQLTEKIQRANNSI